MRTKLAIALSLALLAASLTFSSSFACTDFPQTTASAFPTVAPESDAVVGESLLAQASAVQALLTNVEPVTVIRPILSPTDVSSPSTIRYVDAIIAEILGSVTIVVPGQQSQDNDELEHTGSAQAATDYSSSPDAQTRALDDNTD